MFFPAPEHSAGVPPAVIEEPTPGKRMAAAGGFGVHLVILFGPPAVGKMTVGMELERFTGMPLFHNHMAIEPIVRFFPYGTPPFNRLTGDFRTRILEEVAASDLPGMISTYVWFFDLPETRAFIDGIAAIFEARGADVCFVELWSPLEERLRRNETELRLAEKPSKRDLERSRRVVLEMDQLHRMNTHGDFFYPDRHLYIDNTTMPPDQVAREIIERFDLPTRR